MKYKIGDVVKYLNYKSANKNNFIVIATKKQPLTTEFIKNLKGNFFIKNIMGYARQVIAVEDGFDYVIAENKHIDNEGASILGNRYSCFEEDLIR